MFSWHLSGRDEIHQQSHLSEVAPCGVGESRDSPEDDHMGPLQLFKE